MFFEFTTKSLFGKVGEGSVDEIFRIRLSNFLLVIHGSEN